MSRSNPSRASVTVGLFLAALLVPWVVASCAGPYTPKAPNPPGEPRYCFDAVGHRPGAKPWLLGGTCCCTPSAEVLADWQQHGYFVGLTLEQVLARYKEAGIKTARDHQGCNNMCQWGPHVTKGGKCMVSPTPGTENFEEVLYGIRYVETRR